MKLNHIALQCSDRDRTRLFYTTVLELPLERSFVIDPKLAEPIFGMAAELVVDVFRGANVAFEVFYHTEVKKDRFGHVCLEVADVDALLNRCESSEGRVRRIPDPFRDRTLVFLEDPDGNVFEIKALQ